MSTETRVRFKLSARYMDRDVMRYPGESIDLTQREADDLHALGWGSVEPVPAVTRDEVAPAYVDRAQTVADVPRPLDQSNGQPEYQGRRDMRARKQGRR